MDQGWERRSGGGNNHIRTSRSGDGVERGPKGRFDAYRSRFKQCPRVVRAVAAVIGGPGGEAGDPDLSLGARLGASDVEADPVARGV